MEKSKSISWGIPPYTQLITTDRRQIRPSQQEEAASGYDYAWSWQTIDRDSTVPQALKKLVFLQAKSYKPTGTPGKGSANFTYK